MCTARVEGARLYMAGLLVYSACGVAAQRKTGARWHTLRAAGKTAAGSGTKWR